MIKTMLFDVDGVLVNGEPFSRSLERDYGISREQTAPFFKTIFRDCLRGYADLKQVLPGHLQQWGWHRSVDEFLDYWFASEHSIEEPLVERIQQFRQSGIPCYLATNQERYCTAYILKQMGFANTFDDIFSYAHIGYMKPQVAFFEHVIHKLDRIQEHEILFWDDRSDNIEAAQQIGLQAELYTNFADFEKKIDDYLS